MIMSLHGGWRWLTDHGNETTVDLFGSWGVFYLEVFAMAKRGRGGVNVSQVVRDYKSQHKRAKPKEISEALAEQGTTVSPQYVSTILTNARKKRGGKGRKAAAGAAPAKKDAYGRLVQAKRFVDQIGGYEKAREALDALGRILS
jgi:hypothetical protein